MTCIKREKEKRGEGRKERGDPEMQGRQRERQTLVQSPLRKEVL